MNFKGFCVSCYILKFSSVIWKADFDNFLSFKDYQCK